MNTVAIDEINLTGLALENKTTNANGQSHTDCENLWHTFDKGGYADKVVDRISDEIFGVYFDYESDSNGPFNYFIGCKVKPGATVPQGMDTLTIPAGQYHKIVATGKMPDCVVEAWKKVWVSDIVRTYKIDFEVYDERSKDWGNAEVDVYLSV